MLNIGIETRLVYPVRFFLEDKVVIANDKHDASFMVTKLIDEYTKCGMKINLKTQSIFV